MEGSMNPRQKFSSIRIIAPVPKFGVQMPLVVSPTGHSEFYRTHTSLRREHSGKALSPEVTKHKFAILALRKPGFFARRPHIYLCVRCRRTFLVNERFGTIVAIDHNRNPLPEPENSRQVETFAEGPCPRFKFASKFPGQRRPATTVKPGKLKLRLLNVLASLCPEFKGHQKIVAASKRAQAMLAITPQEFLF
jgi:hypothetical protein